MKFFETDQRLKCHFEEYSNDRDGYFKDVPAIFRDASLSRLVGMKAKAKILVVILQNRDSERFNQIISQVDLPELVRACETLDAPRLVRQLQKKIENCHDQKRRSLYQKRVNSAKELAEDCYHLSLTSSKNKMISQWTRQLTSEQLEYRVVMFDTGLWKKLADLAHLNSKKDFVLDWFLPYCFGGDIPKNTFSYACKELNYSNFEELYSIHTIPYETIRNKLSLKKSWDNAQYHKQIDKINALIVQREPLEKVLWYYDELRTDQIDQYILGRMREGTDLALSYGTLLDLISKTVHKELLEELVKAAESRMAGYEMTVEAPVVVLGDASASMDVAIKTSSIVTSLLCYLSKAELHLFKNCDIPVENPPTSVQTAIQFSKTMQASNSTSPSSSLDFYYRNRRQVKTFIVVTDEEENTLVGGGWMSSWESEFADIYMQYLKEVSLAKLVFISFSDPNTDGQMVNVLKKKLGEHQFNELVRVFKFNVNSPDLNKLDLVLKCLGKTAEERQEANNRDIREIQDQKDKDKPTAGYLESVYSYFGSK